ncbi:MAG: site-specific tyrosine recombinase XerD [Bacteroidales bacterium]|nr:site-specific tyrosine recombinase XerD [Bacteroidales bacterium]
MAAVQSYIKGFTTYLRLEKHLSEATIAAYTHDVAQFAAFLQEARQTPVSWTAVRQAEVERFLKYLYDMNLAAVTQARMLSGLKSFFGYLVEEGELGVSPAELVEAPQWRRHLPEVLTVEEIDRLMQAIDMSKAEGRRNKAILAVLYACGLRVSELTNLRISCLFLDDGFVRVIGKGNKERLVPIGHEAIRLVEHYLRYDRSQLTVKPGCEDIVFLNRRGGRLSREMVFMMIRQTAGLAGVTKPVSPHSFRHSFATHLVEGGADLRAVQEMLGHATITTTEISTHLDKRYLRETIQQFHPLSKYKA